MLKEYIAEVRNYRGSFKDTQDIKDVWLYGSINLVKFMLETKSIGFKTANTFTQLSHPKQDELVAYMSEKRRPVRDIKLKFLGMLSEEM